MKDTIERGKNMEFCSKCGRPLRDGEVCNCDQQMNQGYQQYTADRYQTGNGYNTDMYQNMQQYVNTQGGTSKAVLANNILQQIIALVKNPVTMGKEFVNAGDVITAAVMIILQGILSGLFALIMCIKVQGIFNTFLNLSSSYKYDIAEFMQVKTLLKMPFFKAFLLTALLSVVLTVILTGIFMGANAVAGSHLNFVQMLSLVSLRSLMSFFMIALGCIISLFNVYVGISLFCMGNVAGFLLIAVVWAQVNPVSVNKQIYIMVAAYVVFMVVFAILIKFCWTIYLPEALRLAMNQLKGGLGGMSFKEILLESLGDMF